MSEVDQVSLLKKNTFLPTITSILELLVQKVPDEFYKSIGVIIAPFLAILLNIILKHLYKLFSNSRLISLHEQWNKKLKTELVLGSTTDQRKIDINKEILENEGEIKKLQLDSVKIDFE